MTTPATPGTPSRNYDPAKVPGTIRSIGPNSQVKVLDSVAGRILCIADIRGKISSINQMAREANAKAVLHTGDFGFFEEDSLPRISDRTLRHLTQYSPLLSEENRADLLSTEAGPDHLRANIKVEHITEFPLLNTGKIKLDVPVYTVWGACEDVAIMEQFRMESYAIENLQILDEATTRCIDVGGVKLRLYGLGGAMVPHKMFDNGEGNATIAGGQGTMWTTILQIGELVDTAQRNWDPTETRLLITHASPGREGVAALLALALKADLTISAGLHFRYCSSYNEFSVQSDFEAFRKKLQYGKEGFDKVWESVKLQVFSIIDDTQKVLLDKALGVIERIPVASSSGPSAGADEPAWKNIWNWNLTDAAYGSLVLDIKEGRVSAEMKCQGFNYSYRRTPSAATPEAAPVAAQPAPSIPATAPLPGKAVTPAKPIPSAQPSQALQQTQMPVTQPQPAASPVQQPPPPYQAAVPPANVPVNGAGPNSQRKDAPIANTAKANGAGPSAMTPAPMQDRQQDKNDKQKKDKKNNKKDKQDKDGKDKEPAATTAQASVPSVPSPTAAPIPAPAPAQASRPPVPAVITPTISAPTPPQSNAPVLPHSRKPSSVNAALAADLARNGSKPGTPHSEHMPLSPGTESGGSRTPTSARPQRNPWTLFMRIPHTAGEEDVRTFFKSVKTIQRISIKNPSFNRAQKTVFVEFATEVDMNAALNDHEEKIHDTVTHVSQAEDREPRERTGSFRGGRGGRGRGTFAARGFAAAGLTRGGAPDHKRQSSNSGASYPSGPNNNNGGAK